MKNLCEQAFKDGLIKREQHPLSNGIYKLENLEAWWSNRLEYLELIKNYKRGIGEPYSVNFPCMTEEISEWLKDRPEALAHDIGYYVYPAAVSYTHLTLPTKRIV